MNKKTLIILFVVLTVVFAMCFTTVSYAASGEDTAQPAEFTREDTIKLIVVYCLFGLSIVVGIPAIRAVNRRKKNGYVESIVKETEGIRDKVRLLYDNRDKASSKKEQLRYSIKISAVADMALTTYSEKQTQGYLEIYNDLNSVKTMLSEIDKLRGDEKYDGEFNKIIQLSSGIADKAKELAENENIIRKYNK